MNFKLKILPALFIAILSLSGCNNNEDNVTTKKIDVLRIGFMPNLSNDHTYLKYKAILDRFSKKSNIPYEYVQSSTYEEAVENFISGKVDISYFEAVSYLEVKEAIGAIPLVMRNVDMDFMSYFIVSGRSKLNNIKDAEGKIMAFGSELSTSGHFMPRAFLNKNNIYPAMFFDEVKYSGSHYNTINMIISGDADIGAVNYSILDNMYENKSISHEDIKIIAKSDKFPDHLWVTQTYVNKDFRNMLQESFVSLNISVPEHRRMLEDVGALFFLPASDEYFHEVEKAVRNYRKVDVVINDN